MSGIDVDLSGKENIRAFTIKSFIAGFIGLFIIAAFGKTNVEILKRGDIMACHLGVGAFFYFFLLCAVWNPFVTRFIPFLKLNVKA